MASNILITSTGVSSLDDLMGGGLPLSSITLLKEDRFTSYSDLLLKYSMAQGIAHDHTITFVSLDRPEMINDLMAIVENKAESTTEDNEVYVPAMTGVSGRALGALRTSVTAASDKMSTVDLIQVLLC